MGQWLRARLALHLLTAVIVQLLDHAAAGNRRARRAVLELQLEAELGEELAEHLAAEGADRMDFVTGRIPFQENCSERLRRRAGDHARALGRVVLAVLGAT